MGITWPCFNIDSQAEYSWKKTHVVYLVGSAWCRVLWFAQTERNHYWSSLPNTIDEIEPSTQGKTRYYFTTTSGMTKLFSYMIMLDHMLRRRSKPTWKRSIGKFYPTRRIHQTLPLLITIYFDRWRMACLSSTSYEDTKNWIDNWIALKDEAFFQRGIRMLPERWKKVVASDGQYFQ